MRPERPRVRSTCARVELADGVVPRTRCAWLIPVAWTTCSQNGGRARGRTRSNGKSVPEEVCAPPASSLQSTLSLTRPSPRAVLSRLPSNALLSATTGAVIGFATIVYSNAVRKRPAMTGMRCQTQSLPARVDTLHLFVGPPSCGVRYPHYPRSRAPDTQTCTGTDSRRSSARLAASCTRGRTTRVSSRSPPPRSATLRGDTPSMPRSQQEATAPPSTTHEPLLSTAALQGSEAPPGQRGPPIVSLVSLSAFARSCPVTRTLYAKEEARA